MPCCIRVVPIAGAMAWSRAALAVDGFMLHDGVAHAVASVQAIRPSCPCSCRNGGSIPAGDVSVGLCRNFCSTGGMKQAPDTLLPPRWAGVEPNQETGEHDDWHGTHTPPTGGATGGSRCSRATPRAGRHAAACRAVNGRSVQPRLRGFFVVRPAWVRSRGGWWPQALEPSGVSRPAGVLVADVAHGGHEPEAIFASYLIAATHCG